MTYTYHADPRISAAIAETYRTHPYYATAIGRLRIAPDPAVPTMATSRDWVTHYNPGQVARWTTAETAAVLVHELEHLLRRHAERENGRDHVRWNTAADAEINERLAGLPDGCVYPETIGMPRGMTAETYYGATTPPEPEPDNGEGEGSGSGEGGQGSGASAPGQGQPNCGSAAGGPVQPHERGDHNAPGSGAEGGGDKARRETAQAVVDSIGLGAGEGDGNDALRDWAMAELGIDRSAWYAALATAVGHTMAPFGAPTRWRWPGRRDMRDMGGAMVPRWTGERPSCAVVIDTSSSIAPFDLDMARAAAHYIGRMADVRYYSCNTSARDLGPRIPETLQGGGGTNMRAGIDMAIADGARAVVVITDMLTPWGDDQPSVPVIIGANPAATIHVLNPDAKWAKSYPPPDWAVVLPIVAPTE